MKAMRSVGFASASSPTTPKRLRLGVVIATSLATMLVGCDCGSSGSTPSAVSITPMCTILCNAYRPPPNAPNGRVFVADRTDPNDGSNFTALRAMSGPLGFSRPAIVEVPKSFAVTEAWLRAPGSPVVLRGLAMPARRNSSQGPFGTENAPDFNGSSWEIDWQANDTSVRSDGWMGTLATGTANRGDETDSEETAAWTVPQLMAVGVSEPQVFACAGGRTQKGHRTTKLYEVIPPSRPGGGGGYGGGDVQLIEDVLYGDDEFVSTNDPLAPASKPPEPTVSGPGDLSGGWGAVQCAMTQVGDDLATRELHMIVVAKGHLYHAVASDWGPATDENGNVIFSRFRAISQWQEIPQALGANFGTITSAAIVARSSALSVFFLAEAGGRTRLWHTVRFSDGSWRAAKDVFAYSGDAPNGTVYHLGGVAAADCPAYGASVWDASSTETLVAIWGGSDPNQVLVIRVVQSPQKWQSGMTGVYAPWQSVPEGELSGFSLRSVAVTARPFRDDLMPVP
jgi:hypothetical protein